MTQQRDERGLTEKQRQSLQVVGRSATLHAGVKECVALGIISSTEYFYHEWWKQDPYVEAIAAERMRVFGENKHRTQSKTNAWHDDVVNALIGLALTAGPQQLAAIRTFFEMEGQLSGDPVLPQRPGTQVSIAIGDNGRLQLPERMQRHMQRRDQLLRVLRAAPAEASVLVTNKGGNGHGNGNGNGTA
jgi:hypothetical protein